MVKIFDIVPLPKEYDDLPKTNVPYYVAAKEGLYLYKNTAIGTCLLPQSTFPANLPSMGDFKGGYFSFKAPTIPANIMAQTLDFFRQVWEKQKTEAEVFILLNEETLEYKLFVPYQVVTMASVHSLYDKAHIPEGFTIVGTIHSHCDFSAFHSGTDTADASDFNGLHITIGNVNSDEPSYDVMVMINKLKFSYKYIATVADVSENDTKAPKKWFNFLYDSAEKLIDQYFPTLTKDELTSFVHEARWLSKPKNASVVITDSKGRRSNSQYDDYSEWDDKWFGYSYGGKYPLSTRWSDDFKKSVPAEYFLTKDYGSKLTQEGVEAIVTDELERLFDIASNYGIYLNYELLNAAALDRLNSDDYIGKGKIS